jgi:uncharacterized cofD-like protein
LSESPKAPRIVVIGGGTGSFAALQGLKRYTDQLTAVVSVADDGGSSGRLRDEFGHLPPGDLRKCLLALSPSDAVGGVLRQLFDYRFDRGEGLDGHSFGNLLLTALTEITGGPEGAIREASRLLNISGQVRPVTLEDTRLVAELADGTLIRGETNIDIDRVNISTPIQHIYLDPAVHVHYPTEEVILQADVVVIGPGDLYTSVLPNLLVEGVPQAICASPATKVYACNLMTKPGETDGFRASDFLSEILRYLGPGGSINTIVLNKASFSAPVLARYAREQSFPVEADTERCAALAGEVINTPLAAKGTLVRHDPELLAQQVMQIARRHQAGHFTKKPAKSK